MRSARNLPFVVERQLAVGEGVARLVVADERLGAVRHPVHRPAGLLRADQHRDVFRIGTGLQAERAADVLGRDAELLRRKPITAAIESRMARAPCEQTRSI